MLAVSGEHQERCTVGAVSFAALHPATDPAVIAADQRRAVAAAYRPGLTTTAVAEAVDLPESVVYRRLRELGVEPAADVPVNGRSRSRKIGRWPEMEAVLAFGPLATTEVAASLGAEIANARLMLVRYEARGLVKRVGTRPSRTPGLTEIVWGLARGG